ncbi:unnamed protein product [Rotaria sp. Silwood2]|nr:unnamed protein product [Rotaria sp. Silwood2]CAF3010161.1 unnamed protein product [Rotaria sp. Silwood2]CAF4036268.1 unnamed protein product [Rotaria sp. Silwood2]CAF4129140.1 unnamed protein product [Rotaria sp. Silwood2]CAF4255576.1 unnamed protein product [Rotaria sp. Silwood2]
MESIGENDIDQQLKILDDAIENNREIVLALFIQLKSSIDELELEDEEKYNVYRYQFHLKKSSYLKAAGDLVGSKKEEKFMEAYFAKCQKQEQQQNNNQEQQKTEETLLLSVECDVQANISIKNDIEKCLNDLKSCIDNEQMTYFNELESTIKEFTELSVNSLDEYIKLDTIHSVIQTTVNSLKTQAQMDLEETEGHNNISSFSVLTSLSSCLKALQYQRKVNFASFVLSQRLELRSILFAGIPLTEERIESQTKKLFILFHPDKCEFEQKPIFTQIFQLIAEDASKQLKELTEHAHRTSIVEYHEAKGKEYWDVAIEYKCARKREWDKVKQLKREILMNLTDRELEYHQCQYAICAFEQYRAAGRQFEVEQSSQRLIAKKVELKKYMALSLYLAGSSKMLEAQIYAIAGIHLAVTSGNVSLCKDNLEALEKLLRKTHGANTPLFAIPTDATVNKEESGLSKALVAYSRGSVSLSQLESVISSELRMTILTKCSLRGEERKVAIPEESTLQVRKKGLEFIGKGAVGIGTGAVVAGGIIGKACLDISAGAAIGTLFGGPIGTVLGIGVALTSVVAGGILGYGFFKKSLPYLKEPKIRQNLNKIMSNVLNHYKREEYSDVLYSLSVPFASDRRLIHIREVESGKTFKVLLEIEPTSIVRELLYHDFPPEGIAYFLVLLGEVLLLGPQLKPEKELSANMCLELPAYSDFNYLAIKVFEEVWINEGLIKRAEAIDKQIKSKISIARKICIEYVATSTLAYAYSVSRDYIKDSLVNPVMARLEELKNIAQINYAIAQMIIGGTSNFQKSVNTIKGIREKSMKEKEEKKMFPMTEIRLQALTDLLAAFGHPDNLPSNINDPFFGNSNLPELESSILLTNINKVLISDQIVSYCELIVLFNDDDADEFVLLDKVLGEILKLDKSKFINDVYQAYMDDVETIKSWMKEIIRKEIHLDINGWRNSFLVKKHSLTLEYLPILSKMYDLIFKLCIVTSHRDYSHVFLPTGEVFHFSEGSTTATVYILMDKTNTSRDNRLIKGIFRSCDIPLNYIYNQLESVQDPKLKANLLSQIALHHRRQAEEIDKVHHLEALPKWDRALKLYIESLKSDKNNLTAMLGYAKCLLMLNRYKLAEHYLIENRQKNPEFFNSAERWFLLGVLRRKLHNYDEAIFALREALSLGYSNIEAQNELNVVLKLKQETIIERIQFYKQMNTINAEFDGEKYNILSIDGGGIRGLIPAIWISELERRTGLNSCSMFHMMAGTSTGAIIAAGLSLPDKYNVRIPRYRAVDIVELYTTHSKKVFSNQCSMFDILGSSCKYTDNGRKTLFDLYFENTKLSQTLTDLVIPAVQSGSSVTDLFRRSESLIDPSRNYKLTDVLMCTTAAPTYFSPYKLENSVFVDGGVQANNPALLAYAEACRNRTNRDNMFILSLGTGDYVPDPLHPNASRNLLFWLANKDSVLKVIFDGPQNNIDCQLHNMLGNEKYHRWQVWLEEPIALDDVKKETLNNLMELARAHFEEMDASDSNTRLGKLIERLKDSCN